MLPYVEPPRAEIYGEDPVDRLFIMQVNSNRLGDVGETAVIFFVSAGVLKC